MQSYYLPDRAAYHPKKSPEEQKQDIAKCKQDASEYAGGYDPNQAAASGAVTEGAILGALGAVLGAALGGVFGGSGSVGSGALGGGATGLAGGALHGAKGELDRMHSLYTRQYSVCMRSRGYLVE